MTARRGRAGRKVGGQHRAAQDGQAVATGHCPDQGRVGQHRAADRDQCGTKPVDRVERADRDHQVEARGAEIMGVLVGPKAIGRFREQDSGVHDLDAVHVGVCAHAGHPAGVWRPDQQSIGEGARNVTQPIEAFCEGAFVKYEFGPDPRGAVATKGAQAAVEQVGRKLASGIGHRAACAAGGDARQGIMATILDRPFQRLAMSVLDFALPPRCAGCGEIIAEVDGFCTDCWLLLDWLGNGGCEQCGIPLEATEAALCGRCLTQPPPIDRMRAAVAYGPMARGIALKLKYGRKVALARTMARFMAPLKGEVDGAILVPVPLHRRRLWWRGFNQSGLVAKHLARRWQVPVEEALLRRIRPTPPLKGMNGTQRATAVRGAFAVTKGYAVEGRTIVLIDDVLTSGSTAFACATALRKAGAKRVELICWSRVVRAARLMR